MNPDRSYRFSPGCVCRIANVCVRSEGEERFSWLCQRIWNEVERCGCITVKDVAKVKPLESDVVGNGDVRLLSFLKYIPSHGAKPRETPRRILTTQ